VLLAAAGTAAAKPDEPKPQEPPKPKLSLITQTEQDALRRQALKFGVKSQAGRKVRVEATFVVDGFPDDYVFHLGPVGKRLREKRAKVRLPLSQRQREVLDFAIKSCRGATVDAKGTAAKRTGRLRAGLQLPRDCADTG
jgi:hypothetical protein